MTNAQTIPEILAAACAKFPNNIAFSGLGQTLNYSDLDRLSTQFAVYLQQHSGLKQGDRIALQLPNLLQYPVLVMGALKAGLIVVNTNPLYTPREIEHQFTDAGVKAVVVASMMTGGVAEVLARTGLQKVIITSPLELGPMLSTQGVVVPTGAEPQSLGVETLSLAKALRIGAEGELHSVVIGVDDIAMLQYTGGTTGVSKGAMLTHGNIASNSRQVTTHCADIFREGIEISLCPLPLYHIYAFTVNCVAVLSRGGHSVLVANPRDLTALIAEIRSFPLTGFVGLNTLFNLLLHNEEFRALKLHSLRSTTAGGMALTTEIANSWRELTGIQIAEGYGLTEASPVVLSNPPGRIHPGTVGCPVPGTEIKVIDAEGQELPSGEIGELCVRGPQVMRGYWQQPEATAAVLDADGWLRTGDMAIIQPDNYVRIVDRKKDMIVVSGFNVYPNEVEDIAGQYSGILECAAVGVPDAVSGEVVKLFVVTSDNSFTEAGLKDFLRSQLTAYKIPKKIELVEALPKSNVGKILRRELR